MTFSWQLDNFFWHFGVVVRIHLLHHEGAFLQVRCKVDTPLRVHRDVVKGPSTFLARRETNGLTSLVIQSIS